MVYKPVIGSPGPEEKPPTCIRSPVPADVLVNLTFLPLSRRARVAAVTLMAIGVCLVVLGWWVRPVVAGERARANGDLERAVDQYATGRHRLGIIPFVQDVAPGFYDLVLDNELALQYTLRRYDRILESASGDTAHAPASFWAGCVLFDKAIVDPEPKSRLETMSQAARAFRRALELNPGDWDTKFNYEITNRLLKILQESPQAAPQEIIKLLRDRSTRPGAGGKTG